jgi:hypothetical protein
MSIEAICMSDLHVPKITRGASLEGGKMRWFLFFLAFIFSLAQCSKEDKALTQKKAIEAKKAKIMKDIEDVLNGWLDSAKKDLPEDVKKYPKVKSPLVDFRLKMQGFDWKIPLKSKAMQAKGLIFEKEILAIPAFFEAMDDFWAKKIDFKDYMKAREELKRATDDRVVNMLADFDYAFVHVEALYGASDMEGDDRALFFFRHWQVAFDLPREPHESVSDYLAKLCKERLQTFCKDVPFEHLHFAVEKPYLEKAIAIVEKFLKDYPDCPLNKVFDQYLVDARKALQEAKVYRENPVLPDTVSTAPFAYDLLFRIDDKGASLGEKPLVEKIVVRAKDIVSQKKKIEQMLADIEKERGCENMEVVVVEMPKDKEVGVIGGLVSVLKDLQPRVLRFGARRRADYVARKSTVGSLFFREVGVTDFKGQVEGVGRISCNVLGVSQDEEGFEKKLERWVFVEREKVLEGVIENGGLKGGNRIEKGEDEEIRTLCTGKRTLLLFDAKVPYERLAQVLGWAFFVCDPDCQHPKELKPLIEVQVCDVQ